MSAATLAMPPIKRSYDDFLAATSSSDNCSSFCGSSRKRVVRFQLDDDQQTSAPSQSLPPTSSKQRRQAMFKRHKIIQKKNFQRDIASYENWYSPLEIQQLQHNFAWDVALLETCGPETVQGDDDSLSLSRYLKPRRQHKAFVQRQLLDVVQAVQDFAQTRVLPTHELLSSECSKWSRVCAKVAEWEGLYLHWQVMEQQQKQQQEDDSIVNEA